MYEIGKGNAAHQVGALGEDVIELANLSLELEGPSVKAGQDWVTFASSVAITVSIAISRANVANTIFVACTAILIQ